jgi:O-antigen ligase
MAVLLWRSALVAALTGAVTLLTGGLLAALGAIPLGPFNQLVSAVGLGNVSFGSVNDANFSAVERAAHWLAGVRMFASHPLFGVGIGNYSAAYPAYHPRGWYASLAHAHDYYINIAAEAGVLGLTSYVLLVGSALWYSYATVRATGKGILCAVGLGVTGALLATSFHNIFDVLYVHGMAAFLGLLVSLVGVRASPQATTGSPSHQILDAT